MAKELKKDFFLHSLTLKCFSLLFALLLFACQASNPENQESGEKNSRPSLDNMLHATCAVYGDWQYPCEHAGFHYDFFHFQNFEDFVNQSCREETRYIAWMNKVEERRTFFEEQFSLCAEAMNRGYDHIKKQVKKDSFWQITIRQITGWGLKLKPGEGVNSFDGEKEAFFDKNGKMFADKYGRIGACPYRNHYMEERYTNKNPIRAPLPDNDQP